MRHEANHYREEAEARSFDELTKELASGTLSRGRALKLLGAALVGGALASIPGVAAAASRRARRHSRRTHGGSNTFQAMAKGGTGGNSECAHFCEQVCAASTDPRCQEKCTSSKTTRCNKCVPGVGCGPAFQKPTCDPGKQYNCQTCGGCECPNTCTAPKTQLNQNTCLCECPNTCTEPKTQQDPTTCECSCPPTTCTDGYVQDPESCRCGCYDVFFQSYDFNCENFGEVCCPGVGCTDPTTHVCCRWQACSKTDEQCCSDGFCVPIGGSCPD